MNYEFIVAMTIHKPVLFKETIENLNLKSGDVVIDATLGGGGHSREVLKKIGKSGKLIAIDQDKKAIERFSCSNKDSKNKKIGNAFLVHDNFSNLKNILAGLEIKKVDAILADLGISSDQLEEDGRGLSFRKEAQLDMRMDQTKGIIAADVVNTYGEKDLARIFKEYGDEQYAKRIAKNIVAKRKKDLIVNTSELVEIIGLSVPASYKNKKIHFATKTFQALRMEVNHEIESLDSFLSQAIEVLRSHGRLAVITFHSGEDSLVKHALRKNARGCICPPEFPVCRCGQKPKIKILTKKPILPGEEEIEKNPRSRSAKLRVVEKL